MPPFSDPSLFRSPRPLAKLVSAAFFLYAAGLAWFSLAMIEGIGFMRDVEAGREVDLAEVMRWQAQFDGFEWKLLGVQVIGIVVFLMWVHRVTANLVAWGADADSPSSAVASFFIPFVNLVKPYRILSDVWMASRSPDAEVGRRTSPLLLTWWLVWTIARIGAHVVFRISRIESPRTPADARQTLEYVLASFAVEAVALALMYAVVWRLTGMQDRRGSAGLAEATVVQR
jgi:uncharacterized protein DUF4328